MKLFDPPVETLKSVPRGKVVWNANGGFVSVLLTHLLSFSLQQISTKDYDIVKFVHTFYFNYQCRTVSRQQLIFLKFNLTGWPNA